MENYSYIKNGEIAELMVMSCQDMWVSMLCISQLHLSVLYKNSSFKKH